MNFKGKATHRPQLKRRSPRLSESSVVWPSNAIKIIKLTPSDTLTMTFTHAKKQQHVSWKATMNLTSLFGYTLV